jgi:3-dehydroquinate synthase
MDISSSKNLQNYLSLVKSRGKKILIITDENLYLIYNTLLKQLNFPVLVLKSGEKVKSRKGKEQIEDYLFANNYCKNTELIAFGGGVILDLVGFTAATYMRGVVFSVIATTITALVDASIGGKNGINTKYGKNLLGSFYDPVDVCRESMFLNTLPKDLYVEQFSEIVKIALVLDRDFFFDRKNPLEKAVELKKKIVQLDQKDEGIRQILNFGHTFAHALELVTEYKVSHGRAVWMGLYFESILSYNLGVLDKNDFNILEPILKKEFISSVFDLLDEEKLYNAMLLDKKNKNDTPSFILLKKIGCVAQNIATTVCKDKILSTLKELKSEGLCTLK